MRADNVVALRARQEMGMSDANACYKWDDQLQTMIRSIHGGPVG
jgi:hypothetical protein